VAFRVPLQANFYAAFTPAARDSTKALRGGSYLVPMRIIFPCAALLVASSLALSTAHAVSPYGGHEAVEEEAVRDLAWRNAATWNAHDAVAWADTFAMDAEIVTTGGAAIEGRDAIRARAAQLFSGPYARSTLRVREVRVRLQSRDVAAVDRVQVVAGIADEGGSIAERTETAFFLARNENGHWMITLMRDAPSLAAPTKAG